MPELGQGMCGWCLVEYLFQNYNAVMPIVKVADISLVWLERTRADCMKVFVVFRTQNMAFSKPEWY